MTPRAQKLFQELVTEIRRDERANTIEQARADVREEVAKIYRGILAVTEKKPKKKTRTPAQTAASKKNVRKAHAARKESAHIARIAKLGRPKKKK